MLEIIVFGTGSSAEQFLTMVNNKKVKILAFSDNNPDNHNTKFKQHMVIHPKEILNYDFDYIFVASQFSDEIIPQLIGLGIESSQIIPTDYQRHNHLMKLKHKKASELVKQKVLKQNNKIKIALLNYNYSNYNGYALYKYMPNYIKEKYDVDLIEEKDRNKLAKYDVICSSHLEGIYNESHINVELWHGFPLKKMGRLSNVESEQISREFKVNNTQLIFSYSQMYTTLFNSCFPSNNNKYKITGMPRNDFLFALNGKEKINKITEFRLDNLNILFYLPTWRQGINMHKESERDWSSLFGFEAENDKDVLRIIEENNIFLIVKLHPFEYNEYKDADIFKHERIHLLSDDELMDKKIHLYELLSAADLLITDYSSVFFDTLLIDLPVIFAPNDIDKYQENRGFLIEPYEFMTPGPIVKSINKLNKEINLILNGQDRFGKKRKQLRDVVFKYNDNSASWRVWKEIDGYLNKVRS